jgi:hypothetical protein
MKYIKHKKLMRKMILIAGSCMLIALYSSGCEWNYNQQRQAMGEFFPAGDEMRDVHRIERVQNASGAREDARAVSLRQGRGEFARAAKALAHD